MDAMTDKRKTGEGAMKGWATRRRQQEDRREVVNILIDVHDSINGELVVGERGEPGKYAIGALTLISWRDRLSLALRTLDKATR